MGLNVLPYIKQVYNAATVTATESSSAFTIPDADTYQIIFKTGAGTGTSPTLDLTLEVSYDDGTTYFIAPIRTVQATTSATTQFAVWKSSLGDNEVAWQGAAAATGGTLAKNFITPRKGKITATIGGTSPSYATIQAWLVALPKGSGA